jgi:hypothetical protein
MTTNEDVQETSSELHERINDLLNHPTFPDDTSRDRTINTILAYRDSLEGQEFSAGRLIADNPDLTVMNIVCGLYELLQRKEITPVYRLEFPALEDDNDEHSTITTTTTESWSSPLEIPDMIAHPTTGEMLATDSLVLVPTYK